MTRPHAWALAVLFAACASESADPPCALGPSPCEASTSLRTRDFSLLTLRRVTGPDRDLATWRFEVDELVCTLTPVDGSARSDCRFRDEARVDDVPPLVVADVSAGGFGRSFRVDTLGRARSHVRVFRNDVLVDELDHIPAGSSRCGGAARFDPGPTRDLPPTM